MRLNVSYNKIKRQKLYDPLTIHVTLAVVDSRLCKK